MMPPRVSTYMRVGSAEQLNRAWIIERRNNANEDGMFLEIQMEHFRKLCKDNGYTVVGETVIRGGGEASLPAIKEIVGKEPNLRYILCPSPRSISRRLDEVFAAADYLQGQGITLKYQAGGSLIELPEVMRALPQELYAVDNYLDDAPAPTEDAEPSETDGPNLSM